MLKEEVRSLLNNTRANFMQKVQAATTYVMTPPYQYEVINYVVSRAKQTPGFNVMDLLKFFIEAISPLVEETHTCSGTYAKQMFIKTVWELTRIQPIIISQIRKDYAMIRIDKPEQKELSPEEKRALQAKRMRDAKAAKAAAQKAPVNTAPVTTAKQAEQPVVTAQPQKQLSKEQLETIAMLKNMKV